MVKYEIVSKSSEGMIRIYDEVEADCIGYTPAGFALYIGDKLVYGVASDCGVREKGIGSHS